MIKNCYILVVLFILAYADSIVTQRSTEHSEYSSKLFHRIRICEIEHGKFEFVYTATLAFCIASHNAYYRYLLNEFMAM